MSGQARRVHALAGGAGDATNHVRERGGTHLAATGSLPLASGADFGRQRPWERLRGLPRPILFAWTNPGFSGFWLNAGGKESSFRLAKTVISIPVRRFLRQDIASSECLSVLLLMRRHAERWWEAQNVADALDIAADTAQAQLERLSARNLPDVRLAGTLTDRYHPGTDWLASLVEDVARLHAADRGVVFDQVAGPGRSPSLLAQAFKIRRTRADR